MSAVAAVAPVSLAMLVLWGIGSVAQTSTVKAASAAIASDVGFFLAQKKGYFRQEGLNVEFTQLANGPQMIGPLGRG